MLLFKKKTKEKIDAKLQKINDKTKVDQFRQQLRNQQRKLYNKRMIKGVDYVEPVYNAPFDISEDHVPVMTNAERELYDKRLEMERVRSLSPNTLLRVEEERRKRDDYLQGRIREFTQKILARRNLKSEDAKYDKHQAAKDIRELKAIQAELEQRRIELQYNLRANTGGLIFRETKKLNARKKLSIIKKQNRK